MARYSTRRFHTISSHCGITLWEISANFMYSVVLWKSYPITHKAHHINVISDFKQFSRKRGISPFCETNKNRYQSINDPFWTIHVESALVLKRRKGIQMASRVNFADSYLSSHLRRRVNATPPHLPRRVNATPSHRNPIISSPSEALRRFCSLQTENGQKSHEFT